MYGYKPVPQDEYLLAEGEHQGIVSEELWNKAQARKSTVSARPPKKHSLDHEHLLSGLLKCPVCGGPMYGNVNRKKKKDGTGEYYKDVFYYACKHRMSVDGHHCDYHRQWNQEVVNAAVEELIYKVVDNDKFKVAMVEKIGQQVNVSDLEKEVAALERKLERTKASKNFILKELDNMDVGGLYYEQKQKDFQERLDAKYAEIEALTDALSKIRVKISNVESHNLKAQQVYAFLVDFRKYYARFKDIDKKMFLQSIISDVFLYPEKQPDGRIVKGIRFRFPIFYGGRDTDIVGWDTDSSVETVVLLSKLCDRDNRVQITLDENDLALTSAETKATYEEIKDYILKEYGVHVSNLYISQVRNKYGLPTGKNYNLKKSNKYHVPNCPPEKEKLILDALRHFQMIA